jgi:hypothetical protein
MSCNNCEKLGGNGNKEKPTCPPRMADGRIFTDYRPKCISNTSLHEVQGSMPPNSYEYRQYLINNGEDIMNKNRQAIYNEYVCRPCMEPFNQGTMLPEQRMTKCDGNKCSFYTTDATGLGTGRNYSTI